MNLYNSSNGKVWTVPELDDYMRNLSELSDFWGTEVSGGGVSSDPARIRDQRTTLGCRPRPGGKTARRTRHRRGCHFHFHRHQRLQRLHPAGAMV